MTTVQRVLFGLHTVVPSGVDTHCVDAAGEMVARGIAVDVVLPEDRALDVVAERMERVGASVERFDTDGRRGRMAQLRGLWRLYRLCRRRRPDVVHLHTRHSTGGPLFLAAARAAGRSTVLLTEHNVPERGAGVRGWLGRKGLRPDRAAHALIAVSRRNAAIRRDEIGADPRRFAAILNGVPIVEATNEERAANRRRVRATFGIPAGTVVIGSVVRFSADKGLDDLVRAFALVRRDRPAALLLVGDGPVRDDLESLANELGVAADVVFAGEQPNPIPFLDAMDAFALAVPAGTMSIALLEAMARGLPPVITFCGPEEAVVDGETGLSAPPRDPAGLADALARLVDDPVLRARLGDAAAAHVRDHFSVARVVDDLLDVYVHARSGRLPERVRADGPPNPRPGERRGLRRRGGLVAGASSSAVIVANLLQVVSITVV